MTVSNKKVLMVAYAPNQGAVDKGKKGLERRKARRWIDLKGNNSA